MTKTFAEADTEITQREFADEVRAICTETAEMLIEKNKAYGNSALDPVRVFSKAATDEQLRVRLDDKLSRIARGQVDAFGEDPYADIRGYLVLLEIARRRAALKTVAVPPPDPTAPSRILITGDDAQLQAAWERVPESLAVRNPLFLENGSPLTLMPGDAGYDDIARALGMPGVK